MGGVHEEREKEDAGPGREWENRGRGVVGALRDRRGG